ncbi:MAG: hypothetical protein M1816_005245 [Peltula sp. TS41687]|nr:MAG: hypothetical protein M1816_005245 [Peltula sp. TS41687]
MSAFTPVNTNMDADDAARQLANENAGRTPLVREVSRPPQPDQQSSNDLMLNQVLAMPELREMQPNPRYGKLRGGSPRTTWKMLSLLVAPRLRYLVPIVKKGFQPSQGERSQHMQNALGANKAVPRQVKSGQGRQKVSRRDKVKELKEERVKILERLAEIERELLELEYERDREKWRETEEDEGRQGKTEEGGDKQE